ncbi:uncharacterized protein LOC135494812 [Lineus longissimus]|uniref:uncharacterized protein LOC135494812 n=1 Tax=Lineus longissimus TaxID=88925 RepID=UPI002B4CF488
MGQLWAKSFGRLMKKKEVRILVLGLDASGKTTMLYRMKLGEVVTTIPTIGFNVETVEYKDISFTVWDVGGRGKIRPLYRHYYPNTDAVIFMIDSNDRERFSEMKDEMEHFLAEDDLRNTTFIAMANKQDLPDAMSPTEVAGLINKDRKGFRKDRIAVFPTSAKTSEGLFECFDWLCDELSGKHIQETAVEPWKDMAKDITEEGKTGLKFVTTTWMKLLSTFQLTSKV